jgi:HIP---CoA ligase
MEELVQGDGHPHVTSTSSPFGQPDPDDAFTLPALLLAMARAHPDVEAVVEGDRRITYSELAAGVRGGAAALIASGIEAGDAVAIWAPNSTNWIVAMLSVASAGAVLVPLNTRFQGPEAAYILNRSRAKLLLTAGQFLGRDYPTILAGEELPHLQERVLLEDASWDAFLARGETTAALDASDRRADLVEPDDWLDLMFTSGTTGKPKGVRSTHRATIRSYRYFTRNLDIRLGDRYLLVNPLFHSFGSKAGVVASLTVGATVFPVPLFDPSGAADLIAKEEITVFPGPPTIYYALLQLSEVKRADLKSLRLGVTGAAAVPVELLRRMSSELGFDVVLTAYGLTETAGLVTMCRAGDPMEVVSATSGRAIPGVELATVDSSGRPTPSGEPGEVVVRGYPVITGYFEDPVATAEAIDSDGWLHTGDVGVLDADGGLQITDRIKDMYIVGGFNAYPAEIEDTLMNAPGVAQVAVVGVPDERLGEVGKAFIVARREEQVDEEAVIAFARERMANYKVPRSVEVVKELPVNASGKVMKHVLREQDREERGRL